MDPAPRQFREVIVLVLGVLVLGLATGLVAPMTADAFLRENVVLNPAKTDLTTAAKSVIEKPTFLTENVGEAGAAGGATESGAAAGVYEASGLLPALGAGLLSFGAGVGIGSAICHVIGIEGCWLFESSGGQTDAEAGEALKKGTWEFFSTTSPVAGAPKYAWYWHFNNSLYEVRLRGYTGPESCNNFYQPPNLGFVLKGGFVENYCEVGGKKYSDYYYLAVASSMQNRTLSYSTGNGGFTEYKPGGKAYEAPKDWSEQFAKAIQGHSGDSQAKVGEKIASKIAGSEVANPYATTTVPNCTGLLWLPCKKELEELKLVPERSELGWETAFLTKPADAVVEVAGAGSKVVPGTKTKVITNPKEEAMPLLVPSPESGETYAHYVARLNPSLQPERRDLEAAFIDPASGPNGVVSVSPDPGTRLDPAVKHSVQVSTNPADAPLPSGAWSPPSIPAIDMSPLSGLSPCGVFPFGLFCWVGEALGQFNTTGVCPHFSAPVADTGSDFEVTLCGETADTIMGYLRPAILLAFTVGLGFLFARGTKAIGDD